MSRRLDGWSRTGDRRSRGQATPRMADGSPNWSLPAREPDNSARAIAGRLLALLFVYATGAPLSVAGLWLMNRHESAAVTARLMLAMPGPGPVWQAIELLTATAALTGMASPLVRWWRRRPRTRPVPAPASIRVRVVTGEPVPSATVGQLVKRREVLPVLPTAPTARPVLRDVGSVEVEALLFRLLPPLLLLLALVNATTGDGNLRNTVWPLLAGAVVLAWVGRSLRRDQAAASQTPPAEIPWCQSCEQAPGSITVTFPDGVTFHVCALCASTGVHATPTSVPHAMTPAPSPFAGRPALARQREVRP